MELMPLVVILVVGLVIGLVIYGYAQREQRRNELAAWAAANGWAFNPGTDSGIADRFPAFACLRRGDNRYAENRIEGDWQGRRLLACDYHYETYSRDAKGHRQTHHHCFSLVILGSAVPLQPLLIRPEGFLDKVGEFFGLDDIDFESAEFSRRFYVTAPDKRWAYDVIHPRTMEFLLAQPPFTIQFDRAHVCATADELFAPDRFAAALAVVAGLLDRLPAYLVESAGAPPVA